MNGVLLVLIVLHVVSHTCLGFLLSSLPDFVSHNNCVRHSRSPFIQSDLQVLSRVTPLEDHGATAAHIATGLDCSGTAQSAQFLKHSTQRAMLSLHASDSNRFPSDRRGYRLPGTVVFPKLTATDNVALWSSFKKLQIDGLPGNEAHLNSTASYIRNIARDKLDRFIKNNLLQAVDKEPSVRSTIRAALSRRLVSPLKYLAADWNAVTQLEITPVIAFVNKKSGGLQGQRALDNLRKDLHFVQVCDLNSQNPSDFLNFYKNSNCSLILVCCGGDGTVGWIMDEVSKCDISKNRNITFGIVPFGTGNDLYRHIESYTKHAAEISPKALVVDAANVLNVYHNNTRHSNTIPLDRWAIEITPKPKLFNKLFAKSDSVPRTAMALNGRKSLDFINPLSRRKINSLKANATKIFGRSVPQLNLMKKLQQQSIVTKDNTKLFNNYFGIGIDGLVTIQFDELRRNMPSMFFHKIVNKLWYGILAFLTFLRNVINGRRRDLSKNVQLKCDGIPCPLPPGCQGLVFTNINSYAGGSTLWDFRGIYPWKEQNAGDGIIEAVAVMGLPHLGQIKAGIASAIPIAQGKHFEFSSKKSWPMQIDGEPWKQRPCKIDIRLHEKVDIILPEEKE